jgi:hypothetical protein
MAGAGSPPWAPAVGATLAGALPHARQQIVDGQQHVPDDAMIAGILGTFFRQAAGPLASVG